MPKKRIFTKKEQEFIINMRLSIPSAELAKVLNCSKSTILKYLRENNLSIPKNVAIRFRSAALRKPFTAEEDTYILNNINQLSTKELAKQLKRTSSYVSRRCKELGLAKVLKKKALNSRFQKGGISYNKGLKQSDYMSKEAIERTKKTRFVKGNKPANTKANFSLSFRVHKNKKSYWYVKLSDSNWELLHRFIWKRYNGSIPPGCNIQFKDGNQHNWQIENLFLIDRKEQAILNKLGGASIPYELKETLLLIQKIKQKIRNHEE